jgi:hypothetical protein
MVPAPDDAMWERVQAALERYLLARGNGEALSLLAACDGDAALAARVQDVLGRGAEVLEEVDAEAPRRAVPRAFGDFELLRPLGRGGMGSVWLARQRSLGRHVAVKMLDRAAVDLPAVRVRLQREAELTALLDHPSIVPVYAVGEVDGAPFLAMKYLPGPSLDRMLRPLPPEQVARFGQALARALDAAHVHGIVHRDVKPANVLLDGDTPVLVDFGLARAQSDPTLTQEGKVAGTLRYMAPERLDAASPIADPRVDVYGLGATLYELLVDRAVFAEESPTALVRSILTREPAPLRLRGRHHDLETIVLRALAKEPARRFPTALAMAEDLERYLAGQPVRSRRMPWWLRSLRVAQRHPRTSVAVGLLAPLALIAVLVAGFALAAARADVARRFEAARTDLAVGRHERAFAGLSSLAARAPGDLEIATALARARVEVGLDRVTLLLADRSRNVDAAVLQDVRALVAAARTAGWSDGAAASLPFFDVLAVGHVDGPAAAQRALAALPRAELSAPRTLAALLAWSERQPPPWTLPEAGRGDEFLLTATALRLSAHPPQLVLAELARGDAQLRQSRRGRFLEAIVRQDLGDLRSALALLRGLCDPEALPPVWRWLGNVQLQLGLVEAAGASLQRAVGDRSPAMRYVSRQQQLLAAGPAGGELEALVAAWRQTAGDGEDRRLLAEFDGKTDPARAQSALAELARLHAAATDDPLEQDLLVAAQIEVAAWHLAGPDERGALATTGAHEALLRRWSDAAAALRHPPARATALAWLARSACWLGGTWTTAGLERFAAACHDAPLRVRGPLDYAAAVLALPAETEFVLRTAHLHQARSALDRLAEAHAAGERALTGHDKALLDYRAWLLAVHAKDFIAVVKSTPVVAAMLPEELQEVARQAAEYVSRMRSDKLR